MQITNRALLLAGGLLIGLGLIFLALNFIPGWSFGKAWPLIFFLLAAGFLVPISMFPMYREWIGALFIPGALMVAFGLIFFYNTLTGDWRMWAFGWLLLPTAVGIGLALAAGYSKWGKTVVDVGLWLALAPLALFALFGALFGGWLLRIIGPALLLLAGLGLLVRSISRARG